MKISVTLPSLHPDCLHRTLENVQEATTGHEVEVLAVVPGPLSVETTNLRRGVVRWIEDKRRSGCVQAHYLASMHATGDFITAFADDHSYVVGWDEAAIENFTRGERQFRARWCDTRPRSVFPGPFSLGLRQVTLTPHVGTMFGIYYPYFPLMRLREVRALGGWYDAEKFTNGFSDPDLGMRVWTCGGCCEWADAQTVVTRPEDQARKGPPNYLEDAKTFLEMWHVTYGEGWETNFVRQWDLDVPLSEFGADERTCFRDERVRKFCEAKDW